MIFTLSRKAAAGGSPLAVLCAVFWLGPFAAEAAQPNVEPQAQANGGKELGNFKIIAERNIFNPKRYARTTTTRPRETTRSPRTDTLILTGTMSYEKGRFAFFDGSSSSFRKVLERDGLVGDLKLVRIEPQAVLLGSGTNELRLSVGHQLRRQEGGSWLPGGRAELVSSSRSSTSSAPPQPQVPQPSAPEPERASDFISQVIETALGGGMPPMPPQGVPAPQPEQQQPGGAQPGNTNVPPPAATSSESAEEVLRRLMERREQELN